MPASSRLARAVRTDGVRFVTFGLVGVANTVVSYLVYLALLPWLPYLVAFVLGWVVGVGFSYLMNCRFTYRVAPSWRTFLLFPLSSLPNIVLSSAGVLVMVEWLHWDRRVAPLIATLLAVPVAYLLARTILVRRPAQGSESPADAPPAR